MEEDNDVLYGDLEAASHQAEVAGLRNSVSMLQTENDTLKSELEQARQQIEALRNDKTILETNCVKIFNTATRELQRKDRELTSLREQLLKLRLSASNNSNADHGHGMDF